MLDALEALPALRAVPMELNAAVIGSDAKSDHFQVCCQLSQGFVCSSVCDFVVSRVGAGSAAFAEAAAVVPAGAANHTLASRRIRDEPASLRHAYAQ